MYQCYGWRAALRTLTLSAVSIKLLLIVDLTDNPLHECDTLTLLLFGPQFRTCCSPPRGDQCYIASIHRRSALNSVLHSPVPSCLRRCVYASSWFDVHTYGYAPGCLRAIATDARAGDVTLRDRYRVRLRRGNTKNSTRHGTLTVRIPVDPEHKFYRG